MIELWLEVDLETEPIMGSLRLLDDDPIPFLGWLGLTAALSAAQEASESSDRGRGMNREARGDLTPAEQSVVTLVCDGLTNPEIAQRLSVSRRTVQGHLLKVFKKLQVSTRTQLVARVIREEMQRQLEERTGRITDETDSKRARLRAGQARSTGNLKSYPGTSKGVLS